MISPSTIHNVRKKLYNQGLTDIQIAKQTGVSRQAIQSWRTSQGLPSNGREVYSPREEIISKIRKYVPGVRFGNTSIDNLRKILNAFQRLER